MAKKRDSYLAVYVGHNPGLKNHFKLFLWDMMRYDQCYPVNPPDRLSDWLMFCRPHMPNRRTGFTIGRWESFGLGRSHDYVVGESETGYPTYMLMAMETISKEREG